MERRAALSTVVGLLFALTGCLSKLGFSSENRGVVITQLSIDNFTRSSHKVALEVESDGDTVLSKTYDIEPRKGDVLDGQVIRADLPTEPSRAVIRAEMGEQNAESNLAEKYGEACSEAMVLIERNGSLAIFSSDEGTECFGETTIDADR